ncbi:hypothetical protein E3P92_01727 [Wallemia ichthyophaga]|nr:hypothetical protein E3P98_00892 [Wallemia ichthyophaga]TIA99561.1 hypothetical protein E3P95_01988 [Wallemia ichthyophaga]TIB00608.1 hypothetical protein E3P94_02112 [Wallemia ichthyophaga]TIB15223.1 hypothetical protein E3P92_01727 [Wallemia ichthyophaga]
MADRGRGFGRGRGRGPRRGRQTKDESKEWVPVTKLGRLVKAGKVKSMEEIYLFSIPVKEYQIVDFFLPKLKDEVMKISPVQKQTRAGQRTRFKAFVAIGDSDGHVGLGVKCAKEVATAIRGAMIAAKLATIPVRRGYWGNALAEPHTVPCKVSGKCGSVMARLVPAPRGTGIVAAPASKRMLQLAGIQDCYTQTKGNTSTMGNFIKATFQAISAIAFSGALGAVVSNGIVYPLDTLKTRIQAKDASDETEDSESSDNTKYQVTDISNDLAHIPKNTLINGIIKLFKQEGIAAAYGGFGASMLNTFSQQFAYFYWYGAVRTAWIKSSKNNGNLSTVVELLIGAIAGDLAQIFTIPVNVIATRQQIGVQGGNTNATFFSVAKQIITDDGLTGLWRGLQPSLVLSVNPAITYGAYEKLKTAALSRHLSRSDGRMSPWANFFLGAMSKTAATIVTYPYIMAKVRVMAGTPVTWRSSRTIEQDKKELKKNTGALKLLMHIYKKRGIAGWYQGMHAQIVKAVLQQALLFVLRDIFEKYTLFGVLILRSLRSA